MDPDNYYKTLGVSHNASQAEINHAYRLLAKKYHPDVNHTPGASKKFEQINQAYNILGNSKRRAEYDAENSTDFFKDGSDSSNKGFGFGSFSNLFNDFFGEGNQDSTQPKKPEPETGQNLKCSTTISFVTAAFGGKARLNYKRHILCPNCKGSGAEKGSGYMKCPTCDGTGSTTTNTKTPLGTIKSNRTCPTCHGTGRVIKNKCHVCYGKGTVVQNHEIEVTVPTGIHNGEKLRLQRQGEVGKNGGQYGDLYIVFKVKPSKHFKVQGNDLILNQPISVSQAAFGGNIKVRALDIKHKTEDGHVALQIPASTESGSTFRLANLGLQDSTTGDRGSEKVVVHIGFPKKLNHKQKQALIMYAKASHENTNGSVFNKMKNLFNN